MIEHDEGRERELQSLAQAILMMGSEFSDDPNGPYRWTCPFCSATKEGGHSLFETGVGMDELTHDTDCPYLIAKGLRTGEERK